MLFQRRNDSFLFIKIRDILDKLPKKLVGRKVGGAADCLALLHNEVQGVKRLGAGETGF